MADKAGGAGSTGGVKLLLVALTAVAIAAISAAAIFSAVSGSSGSGVGSFTPNDEGLLEPGSRAPEFTASSVDGGEVSLPASGDETATAAGKATLLVFFATWCPHCQDEAPVIAELSERDRDLRVIMAGVDGEDNLRKVRNFVDEYNIEGEALYDPSLDRTYRITGYPTVYVLDGSGEIVGANSGETPKDVLEDWIEQARA